MKLRFQADADIHPAIRKGVLRREPRIDFRAASGVVADATPDPTVLAIAAAGNRVLVTGDVNTMAGHFRQFVAGQDSPGVLLIPSSRPIAAAIEGVLLAWLIWTPDDLRNRIQWLP